MPAPYFLSAFFLAGVVGMCGAPDGVVIAVFLILWAAPHALRLATWFQLRKLR